MILDSGRSDADIGAMLAHGRATIQYQIPPPPLWRMAALKHAYLAACLALGEIPDTPHARQARADLIAARDHKRGDPFPESQLAAGLRVAQSYLPAQGPTIVLAALTDDDGRMQDGGLSLAGTFFVSWPLDAALFWEAARRANASTSAG